jgi:phage tail-like protein
VGEPATGIRFEVKIDGVDIGSFTGCAGLGAEYEIFEYQEGGQNAYVHRLPGRLKYSPVTLTRPIDEKSGELAAWFASFRDSVKPVTGCITAFDPQQRPIAQWNLTGLYPSRWTGPGFSSDGNSVVKETLELSHNGFLE